MGRFLRFSDKHSSFVANVCNLSTGYISPKFHLVFGDLFETVIHTRDDESVFNAIYNNIFEFNRYWYAKDKNDNNGNTIYQTKPLEEIWLDEKSCRD